MLSFSLEKDFGALEAQLKWKCWCIKKKIKDAAKILERISFLPFPIDVKKKMVFWMLLQLRWISADFCIKNNIFDL